MIADRPKAPYNKAFPESPAKVCDHRGVPPRGPERPVNLGRFRDVWSAPEWLSSMLETRANGYGCLVSDVGSWNDGAIFPRTV
jgi:hypothetical protein